VKNKRPPERDRAQRASEESQCMELHETNREKERLALAEKVTQFYAKKHPLRSDHARGQFM